MWRAWAMTRMAACDCDSGKLWTGSGFRLPSASAATQLVEHRQQQAGSRLRLGAEVEGMVGDVGTPCRHRRRVEDVAFAEFEEASAPAQAAQARRDELTGQRVQHHLDAGATGGGQDVVGERQGARIEHVRHAHGAAARRACARMPAVANTSAPLRCATCTAARPTPPAAA